MFTPPYTQCEWCTSTGERERERQRKNTHHLQGRNEETAMDGPPPMKKKEEEPRRAKTKQRAGGQRGDTNCRVCMCVMLCCMRVCMIVRARRVCTIHMHFAANRERFVVLPLARARAFASGNITRNACWARDTHEITSTEYRI